MFQNLNRIREAIDTATKFELQIQRKRSAGLDLATLEEMLEGATVLRRGLQAMLAIVQEIELSGPDYRLILQKLEHIEKVANQRKEDPSAN